VADEFIELPVETEPLEIALDAFAHIAGQVPGWEPAEGNLDTLLIEADAQETAVDRALLVEMSTEIFRYIGGVFGIDPLDPTAATVASTWTMTDTAGHTIPAGTQVALEAPDGSTVGFRTTAGVTVAAGQSVTAVGGVTLEAVEEGAHTSGLSTVSELIDQLAFVQSIALVGTTTGGIDGETNEEYVNRLAERLRLQSTALILPRDFEIAARDHANVARAVAVDGYRADTQASGQERALSVAVADEAGEPLSSPDKALIDADFQANRETNFLAFVMDATYTTVDVVFAAKMLAGFVAADVEANAESAISTFLSPANWGLPSSGDGDVDWVNRTVLRYQELVTVLNNVEGIDYYTALTAGDRKAATIAAATNLVTSNAHGYALNDPVVFRSLTGGAGLVVGTTYFARDITANTFGLAATQGGAQIDVTSDATAAVMTSLRTADITLAGVVALTRPGTIDGTVSA
jgi:Baseplate J-like protein